jgi:hypothetical protein
MGDLETGVRDARDFSQELPNSLAQNQSGVFSVWAGQSRAAVRIRLGLLEDPA